MATAAAIWGVFFAFWLIAARGTKAAEKREGMLSRLSYGLLAGAGVVLMFARRLPWGPLGGRWLPRAAAVDAIGFVVIVAGLAFAVWARLHLGRNWSGTITLKVDHELIRSGPYAWVRHPIYAGMVLAMFGTALVNGEWRALLGVALVLAGFLIKSRIEDAWMGQKFGAEYQEYRRRTGGLLPRLVFRKGRHSSPSPGSASE